MQTTVIKIFGGPGAGKSVLAARIFAELKIGYSGTVEYVQEYAKSLVWQGKVHLLSNQPLVTNGQKNMLMPLVNKVDIVVTDSPLELGLFYTDNKEHLTYVKHTIQECNKQFNSINLFIERGNFAFEQQGRVHSLEQSKIVDKMIIKQISNLQFVNHNMNVNDILAKIHNVGLEKLCSNKPLINKQDIER
ncbi:AAA family ATPase [Campylobacter fetus]|uniref:AAA family ATPase n=1 Tax=Campylobacter fetus TaxID=196 RepID=UPI000818AC83|nr:DNA/RNA helicase domain-containing protein [Campylobacter fetus]OCR84621.1 hypothetical protein CFT12S05168_08940 [Campylobacter fetus subsp. testudinum]OCR95665.1 hypothetical protein CFT12S02847_07600 [Campylobacter fetus subsp. testudinum]